MKKSSHLTLSFSISLWIFYIQFSYDIFITFVLSFFTAIFSSLPDIDLKIIKKIKEFNKETFYILSPITFSFKLLFKHRTITHTIYLPIVLLILDIYFTSNLFLNMVLRIFYLAIFLHLIEDSLTKSGIKPLYPIPFKLKLFDLSTSSKLDFLFLKVLSSILLFTYIFYIVF